MDLARQGLLYYCYATCFRCFGVVLLECFERCIANLKEYIYIHFALIHTSVLPLSDTSLTERHPRLLSSLAGASAILAVKRRQERVVLFDELKSTLIMGLSHIMYASLGITAIWHQHEISEMLPSHPYPSRNSFHHFRVTVCNHLFERT